LLLLQQVQVQTAAAVFLVGGAQMQQFQQYVLLLAC
jgi:hypothetical protein